eukprot:516308_1
MAYSIDFGMLKSANIDSQLLVFGFVRDTESVFDIIKTDSNNFHMNVPPLISWIILSYYHAFEYFAVIGNDITVSDDKMSITKNIPRTWRNSSYGSMIIPSESKAICKWDLKMSYLDVNRSAVIGIISGACQKDIPFAKKVTKNSKFYAFYCRNGKTYQHTKENSIPYSKNAKDIKQGDIISVKLDLKTNYKQINYIRNGKELGPNINIETGKDIQYRLAVTISVPNTHITITAFEYKLLK